MTKELIELIAEEHKIDFFTMEVIPPEGRIVLRAPYMTKAFVKEIERWRPAVLYAEYQYHKGFISWLAWRLRKRKQA
jgi:hypothetical protein